MLCQCMLLTSILWANAFWNEWTGCKIVRYVGTSSISQKMKVRGEFTPGVRVKQVDYTWNKGIPCWNVWFEPWLCHGAFNSVSWLCIPGSSRWWSKQLSPCYPCERPGWNLWLLAAAWLEPSCFRHMRSEQTSGWYLCLFRLLNKPFWKDIFVLV